MPRTICKPAVASLLLVAFIVASVAGARASQVADEVVQAFYDLVDRDPFVQRPAARFLSERGERDALPFMVATMRYDPFRNESLVAAVRELSGQDLGDRYEPWMEWVIREDIAPHPAFRQWKADLMARLHPGFGEFLDPQRETTIDYLEIQWGGVEPEGIPSLDDPDVIGGDDADFLTADELVFGVTIEAPDEEPEARAYPLRILDWHEMTNDVVNDVPIALSYCTLCGSAVLFDRRTPDDTLSFATSGLLYRSNKLMFDRQTRTLWSNLTGKPVLGPLVGSGVELTVLPVEVTTWGDWLSRHPDTTVLSLETGYERDYTPGAPYGEYFASGDLMFPVALRDDRLPDKAWVFGMRAGESAMAFDLEALQSAGVLNTDVGDQAAVLIAGAGRAVRAYDRGETTFRAQPAEAGQAFLIDDQGDRWRVTDIGLQRVEGSGFRARLPGHLAYWFGWYAFFPHTDLWMGEGH